MTAGAPAHRHGEVDIIFNVSARLLIDGLARRTSPIPTEPRAPAGKIRACLARLPAWCLPRSLPHVGPHRQTDADARLCLARQAEPSAADTTATWCSSSQPCIPGESAAAAIVSIAAVAIASFAVVSTAVQSSWSSFSSSRSSCPSSSLVGHALPLRASSSRAAACERACLCRAGRATWCKPACASGASQRTPAERACGRAWSARAEAA